MKDFEKLFLDKKFDQNIRLTEEDFYTYTVKIAIFFRLIGLFISQRKSDCQSKQKEVVVRKL